MFFLEQSTSHAQCNTVSFHELLVLMLLKHLRYEQKEIVSPVQRVKLPLTNGSKSIKIGSRDPIRNLCFIQWAYLPIDAVGIKKEKQGPQRKSCIGHGRENALVNWQIYPVYINLNLYCSNYLLFVYEIQEMGVQYELNL